MARRSPCGAKAAFRAGALRAPPRPGWAGAPARRDLHRPIAHEEAKVSIELIDALRLLVQSHLDAFQQAYQLIYLSAEILVLEARDIHPAARKVIGGVAAVPCGTAVVAAVCC